MKETNRKKGRQLLEAAAYTQEVERAYYESMFQGREKMKGKGKYAREKWINSLICQGEVDQLKEIFHDCDGINAGEISGNPFRQQLYAIIIGVALSARAAMEGGLAEEEAYTLSDVYIHKADSCTSAAELWKIYGGMVIDFAERVQESKYSRQISNATQIAIDYILSHLHYDINLKEIAEQAGFSETYFSALFKKETGDTVTEFIQKSRVEKSENLLRYSEYSLKKISQYLGFCSQSHFSQTFRRYTGMTPGQYRKKYFKRNW